MWKWLLCIALVAACAPNIEYFSVASCGGDAAVDSPEPDASHFIDPLVAWPEHVMFAGPVGADGLNGADIDGSGRLSFTTPFEEAKEIVVATNPGCGEAAKGAWPSQVLTGQVVGAEDSIFSVIAGQRVVVAAGSASATLWVYWGTTSTALRTEIVAAHGVTRWSRVATGDFDGDGLVDVMACGDPPSGGSAQLVYYTSPTPADPNSWTGHVVGPVGICQEMRAMDVNGDGRLDVVLSDKDKITYPALRYDLRGDRAVLNTSNGWVNLPIVPIKQPNPQVLTRWSSFGVDARTVIHVAATGGANNVNFLSHWSSLDGVTWQKDFDYPALTNFGWVQSAIEADLNLDGLPDLVVSGSNAPGSLQMVVGLINNGDGTYTQITISGPGGCKADNIVIYDFDCDGDPDVGTTSQPCSDGTESPGDGMIWYENKVIP